MKNLGASCITEWDQMQWAGRCLHLKLHSPALERNYQELLAEGKKNKLYRCLEVGENSYEVSHRDDRLSLKTPKELCLISARRH